MTAAGEPVCVDEQVILEICRILNQHLGFTYGGSKRYLISSRLNHRLRELNLPGYSDYLQVLWQDPREIDRLFDLLTTHVTGFFREPDQYQILSRELAPMLMKRFAITKKLRCWSAGCSSGEEAYTLAMVLSESLGPGWDIKILASDISREILTEGMSGIYAAPGMAEIPQSLARKYFTKSPDGATFQVRPELREQVVFRRINLNETFEIPGHIHFALIFCRNVFIYLSVAARERIIEGFHSVLEPGGFLFVGHYEPLNILDNKRWRPFKNCIYQKV